MEEKMEERIEGKNRGVGRALLLAAGVFVVLGLLIWGAESRAQAKAYQQTTQGMYVRAFAELEDVMSDLTVTLSKLLAVDTPAQTVLLLDDVWRLSGSGVSLMAQLPQTHVDTAQMNRFIVQLGDYAHALTKKALQGVLMGAEDRAQLQSLYETSARLSGELTARLERGDIPLAVITNADYYGAPSDGAIPGAAGGAGGAGGTGGADGEANDAYKDSDAIGEFPTLIYDGPFSQSTEKAEPKGLRGARVGEAEARAIAEKAAGVPLAPAGYSDGKIKSYDFSGTDARGAAIEVSVTATGGHILWMMGAAQSDITGVPPQSETRRYRDIAVEYLYTLGYAGMRATYAQYYGGSALINCAAVQDGVILYNDLIKVWVDRESLSVVGVDARNYLFSHTPRALETPAISLQQAEGMLLGELTVEDRAVALIPISPQREKLCYEFKCRRGADAYILYLSVEDGSEQQIFRILDSEDGEMVI